jgi:hypothetical protein
MKKINLDSCKKACQKLLEAKYKCISNFYTNQSGVLWESLWKFEDDNYMQKTCTSGLFNDWRVIGDFKKALFIMSEEIEIIERINS